MGWLRKFDFGPLKFSSEFMIACPNPILVHFSIVRISDFGPDSYFESKFEQNRKVDQNRIWTRDHKFRREIEWTKIEFSKPVRMNTFKHFSGLKKTPA